MATEIYKPYHTAIAIKIDHLAASIIHCTAQQAISLQSEDGKRKMHIRKGEPFYLVASESAPGYYYVARFIQDANEWRCSCPSVKPCKHEKALKKILVARYRKEQQAAVARRKEEKRQSYFAWKASLSREEFENARAYIEMMEDAAQPAIAG